MSSVISPEGVVLENPTLFSTMERWKKEESLSDRMREEIDAILAKIETLEIDPINWNDIKDPIDLIVWNRLNANTWWPEKVAISNDIPTYDPLEPVMKTLITEVFTGLTTLDTLQSRVGAAMVSHFALTPHEPEVMNEIQFMESVHARSYSSIFSTLCSSDDIDRAYRWARANPLLKKKKDIILRVYKSGDGLKVRIASVMLESFLFYTGFYAPLYLSSEGIITNTADIIKLIIRDESLHGYYIGYKFQEALKELSEEQVEYYHDFARELLMELYEIECLYTEQLYDPVGWTEDVKKFLRYNANLALMNLGIDELFPEEETQANTRVIAALTSKDVHDFFSGAGSTYKFINVVDTLDSDYDGVVGMFERLNPKSSMRSFLTKKATDK